MRGISLIMPVYHSGNRPEEIDHLHEALSSVLALTLSPDMIPFELIIIDDASKNPRTQDVIKEYASRHPWIKIISNETNHGPSYARNRALEIAQYDHIAGVDADDILTNNAAKFYRDAIDKLYNDSFMAYINPTIKQFGTINCLSMIPHHIKDKEVALIGYAPACAVYRTDDVKDVGGWRVDAPKAEDWKLAVDVLASRWRKGLSNHIITLPHISYLYRQYDDGKNVNARIIDKHSMRTFLIDGNEDFYKDRFGTDSPDVITSMISTKLKRLKHGGVLRAVFASLMDNPRGTISAVLGRSQSMKRIFNAVGLQNPFLSIQSHPQPKPQKRFELG
jgi:glycosyltransferase involved in cell wall biosynthesis